MPAARRSSVLAILPLVQLARDRGIDPLPLLRKARIAAASIEDPSARVPFACELAFVRALLERTRDPALGLEAGARYHLALFGLLGAAASAAPTIRDVIRIFLEHLDLTFTPFAVALRETPGEGQLIFADQTELGILRRFYLDRDIAFVVDVARTLWPELRASVPSRIQFDYPEPPEAARYRAAAQCQVIFGADVSAVVADLSFDRPRHGTSPLGLRVVEHELERAFGSMAASEDLLTAVRRIISIEVTTRATRADARFVAAALDLRERTLRRRLAAASTSFRALEDEVLEQVARRHLERGLSVVSVAERLGYAEPASFVRAYRRWTGHTPGRHRRHERQR
ncbi:MAG TPA: AraC family transcriptional regulator [Polyangiaceae bacterium]